MNYNQVLQYIVQWVKENHNNEITGDILQSVLIEMLQYTRDQDDSLESGIEDLQSQIDNISISQTLNVFLGVDDPNITPPTETYQAPDIYVKTDTDDLYIYSGSEWVQLTNLPEVNNVLTEFRIDDLSDSSKAAVVDYINNLVPPYNKTGNENLVITLYENGVQEATFWLVSAGKGFYGSGQNQISEENLVSFIAFNPGVDGITTDDTDDIELSGDGTAGNPLEAMLTEDVRDDIDKGVKIYDLLNVNPQVKVTASETLQSGWDKHTVFFDGTSLTITVNPDTEEPEENFECFFRNNGSTEVSFVFATVSGWSYEYEYDKIDPGGVATLMRVLNEKKLILFGNE